MRVLRRAFCVVVAIAALRSPVRAAQQDTAPDSVELVPGARYAAGWLHRWLLGDHYRDLWTRPVRVAVLDLERVGGGLIPECRGGGVQTISLRLRGGDGRQYTFRSLDKDPSPALPKALRRTPVAALLQDQISSHHPAGALMVAPLLAAVGVLHAEPQLRVMADQPVLGAYRLPFGGMLGTLEERPRTGFAQSARVDDTEHLWDRLEASPVDRVDARAFLTARLVDILVGDWDRHFDQWSWARYDSSGVRVWRPIPRDRDQAFVRLDGVVLWAARHYLPQLVSFGPEYPDLYGLTWSARALDRRFLVELEKPAWDSVVRSVQRRLTDSVLHTAVGRLPAAMQPAHSAALLAALQRRRDRLGDAADAFYPLVAEFADVRATDQDDIAEIDRLDDSRVRVRLASASAAHAPYFTRTFVLGETAEIRVYLAGGNDRATVRGTVMRSPVVRVVGGNGDDTLVDSSAVGIPLVRAVLTRTFLHDAEGDNRFEFGAGTEVDRRSFRPPPRRDAYPPPPPGACGGGEAGLPPRDLADPFRDFGSRWTPAPFISFQPDLGLLLGIGADRHSYAFRKVPFGSHVGLRGLIATGPDRFRVWYDGDFRNLPRGAWGSLGVRYSGIELVRYHGVGNETRLDSGAVYRLAQRQVTVHTSVTAFPPNSRISIGPFFEFVETELGTGSLVDSLRPYGAEGFAQVGLQGRLEVDTRDRPFAPRTGMHLIAGGRAVPKVFDPRGAYGTGHLEVSTYLSAGEPARATLALRLGGSKVWGDAPFFGVAFAGGARTLRGYHENRFGGDAAVYANAELRLFLTRLSLFLPGELGILGLGDAGRVFLTGERSERWHHAGGGGIWMAFIERGSVLTLTVARSPERWAFYGGVGFMF